MTSQRPHTRRAVLIAAVLGTAACTTDREERPESSRTAQKNIEKSAQTDPSPLLSRTRGIPEEATVMWFSGTTGSGAPGPSTYWIDARIEVDDAQAEQWRSLCEEAGEPAAPDVVRELAEELGNEEFRECPALAAKLGDGQWEQRAWISNEDPVVVLTLFGDG
ncbi:hypothetical protein [Brachybacterium paraconglomeratum]|uniref:hypothetical protein n=1 Tax=Brachybacterium paraconglomeratum TaxID=173362 RepID=UPI00026C715E|nr:hypothetical protein [Brachybacterium paraconglomeratum]